MREPEVAEDNAVRDERNLGVAVADVGLVIDRCCRRHQGKFMPVNRLDLGDGPLRLSVVVLRVELRFPCAAANFFPITAPIACPALARTLAGRLRMLLFPSRDLQIGFVDASPGGLQGVVRFAQRADGVLETLTGPGCVRKFGRIRHCRTCQGWPGGHDSCCGGGQGEEVAATCGIIDGSLSMGHSVVRVRPVTVLVAPRRAACFSSGFKVHLYS